MTSTAVTHSAWTVAVPVGSRSRIPMRSAPGSTSDLLAVRGDRDRRACGTDAAGAPVTSSTAAVSRTVRVTTCSATRKLEISLSPPPSGTRPRVGLRPTSPQHDAGMRIEPPPSFACATGDHAARDRGGRASARAAGGGPGLPRVVRRSVGRRLRGGEEAELGGVGAAEDDEPGVEEALRDCVGVRRPVARVAAGTACPRGAARPRRRSSGPSGGTARRGRARRAASAAAWASARAAFEPLADHGVEPGLTASIRAIAASTSSARGGGARPDQVGLGDSIDVGGIHAATLPTEGHQPAEVDRPRVEHVGAVDHVHPLVVRHGGVDVRRPDPDPVTDAHRLRRPERDVLVRDDEDPCRRRSWGCRGPSPAP